MVNSLSLQRGVRAGTERRDSASQTRREFVTFVVDGDNLGELLGPMIGLNNLALDLVPVLVFNWSSGFPGHDFDRLKGELEAALPGGRIPLYVCAECGDLGCGSVTVEIEQSPSSVIWRNFGYQNGYEPFEQSDTFPDLGPFTFDRAEYDAVLQQFKDEFEAQRGVG